MKLPEFCEACPVDEGCQCSTVVTTCFAPVHSARWGSQCLVPTRPALGWLSLTRLISMYASSPSPNPRLFSAKTALNGSTIGVDSLEEKPTARQCEEPALCGVALLSRWLAGSPDTPKPQGFSNWARHHPKMLPAWERLQNGRLVMGRQRWVKKGCSLPLYAGAAFHGLGRV